MTARRQLRAEKHVQLREWEARAVDPAFVARTVAPLVPEVGTLAAGAPWTVDIVRSKGSGRLTIRYAFGGGPTVYAKVYTDGLGATSAEALRALWGNGFGPRSPHKVPEPLGFLPDENFLVMREVRGEPLAPWLLSKPFAEVLDGIRAAAQWLAHLHATVMPHVPVEPPAERIKVLKVADMQVKAASKHPRDAAHLVGLFDDLRALAPRDRVHLVPTHGQYTASNVYLDEGEVNIIDLDRLCLSDAAKDVAMFAHRSASLVFRRGADVEAAERLAQAFVDEYLARAEREPVNLPYYLALYSLKAYAKCAKDFAPEDPRREEAGRLYLSRLERCAAAAPRRRRALPAARERAAADRAPALGRFTSRSGARGRAVLAALREAGFAAPAPYRVPDPDALDPETGRLRSTAELGVPLSEVLIAGGAHDLVADAAREAARWLAALHGSAVAIGRPEQDWDSLRIFRICRRLIAAAAARPDYRDLLLDLAHSMSDHFGRLPERRRLVQAHGRYAPHRVFIGADATTAIHFARSRPADPARDVADFVTALERLGLDHGRIAEADVAATAFLEEYARLAGGEPEGFPYHRAASLVFSLAGLLHRAPVEDLPLHIDRHAREMRRVMELRI
jgi:hypothetical protein